MMKRSSPHSLALPGQCEDKESNLQLNSNTLPSTANDQKALKWGPI